ncbi:MAG: hypothetical protein ACKV2U_12700 [Bryobacteraceae bacterium]
MLLDAASSKWHSVLVTADHVRESGEVPVPAGAGRFKFINQSYRKSKFPVAGLARELCTQPEHRIFDF